MALIDDDFIQDLNDRPIVDVLDALGIKYKGGVEKLVSCITPDHEDKNASMSINEASGKFNCKGCGCSGGGAMDLYAKHMGMNVGRDFIPVIEGLSSLLGQQIIYKKDNNPIHDRKSNLKKAMAAVVKYTMAQPESQQERDSFIEFLNHRGLDAETVKKLSIGYMPTSFTESDIAKKYAPELIEMGVLQKYDNNSNPYCPLAGRVIFPITNRKGEPIALGARVLKSDPNNKKEAKYRNTSESIIYSKKQELYGLSHAIKSVPEHSSTQLDEAIVFEGYMDVAMATQHGMDNTVAACGTAVSNQQIKQIARVSKGLTFVMDGDEAGKKASMRALLVALPFIELNVKIAILPEVEGVKHDPDSFIKKYGPDQFKKYVDVRGVSAAELSSQYVAGDKKVDSILDLARHGLMDRMKEVYDAMPDGIVRKVFSEELAQKIGKSIGIELNAESFGIIFNEDARKAEAIIIEKKEARSQMASAPPSTSITTPAKVEQPPAAFEYKNQLFQNRLHAYAGELLVSKAGEIFKAIDVVDGKVTKVNNQSIKDTLPPAEFVVLKKAAETRSKFDSNSVRTGDRVIRFDGKWISRLTPELYSEARADIDQKKQAASEQKAPATSKKGPPVISRDTFRPGPPNPGDFVLLSNGEILKAVAFENGVMTQASNQKHEVLNLPQNIFPITLNVTKEHQQQFPNEFSAIGDRIVLIGDKWTPRLSPDAYQQAPQLLSSAPVTAKAEATNSVQEKIEETAHRPAAHQITAHEEALTKGRETSIKEGMLIISAATKGDIYEVISAGSGDPVCLEPMTGDIEVISLDSMAVINAVARSSNSQDGISVPLGHPIFQLEAGGDWLSKVPASIVEKFYAPEPAPESKEITEQQPKAQADYSPTP
jgi:DNA primase catalytic core